MKAREQLILAGKHRDHPWDRMPHETGKAYEAFILYREMGVTRSIAKVAEMFDKSVTLIVRWRQRWDWDIRVAAWDAKLSKARDDAAVEEAKRMGVRQARLGMKLQEVGGKRLEQFATSPELQESLTARDTLALIKEGAELERVARGDDPDKGKGGNIIFNITMKSPPKWAPKNVIEGALAAVSAVSTVTDLSTDGNNTQETTP
jgi:hypothetical protein